MKRGACDILLSNQKDYQNEIIRLRAQADANAKDRERLEGIMQLAQRVPYDRVTIKSDIEEGGLWAVEIGDGEGFTEFTSYDFREAIDAAIAQEKDGKE
jgi:hypothetical protein